MESRRWMLETRFRRQKTDGINAPTGGRSLVFVGIVVVVAIGVGCIVLFLFQLPCLAGICYGLPFSLAEIFQVLMLNELLIFLADGDLGVNQFNNTVVHFQCHLFGLIEVLRHLFF